ncbi:hypothetical protein DA469_21880, partial [Bacillus subtilis]
RNWGKENFAKSADYICERYNNAKLICKFQKRGTERDRSVFIKGVELLDEGLSQIQTTVSLKKVTMVFGS